MLIKAHIEVASTEHTEAGVSNLTSDHLSKLHKAMKAKGFAHKASRQSALETHTYTKGDHRVEYSGWHGAGKGNRNYGDLKIGHELYDNKGTSKTKKKSYEPVHEVGGHHVTSHNHNGVVSNELHEAHEKFWTKVHKHVSSL